MVSGNFIPNIGLKYNSIPGRLLSMRFRILMLCGCPFFTGIAGAQICISWVFLIMAGSGKALPLFRPILCFIYLTLPCDLSAVCSNNTYSRCLPLLKKRYYWKSLRQPAECPHLPRRNTWSASVVFWFKKLGCASHPKIVLSFLLSAVFLYYFQFRLFKFCNALNNYEQSSRFVALNFVGVITVGILSRSTSSSTGLTFINNLLMLSITYVVYYICLEDGIIHLRLSVIK